MTKKGKKTPPVLYTGDRKNIRLSKRKFYYARKRFHAITVVFVKSADGRAVDVEHAEKLAVFVKRHYDLRA